MKKVTLYSTTRDDFILLGKKLGRILADKPRQLPWVVDLNGDEGSGKSLLGLGIDTIFRPERYPDGVVSNDISSDTALSETDIPVVYENFRRCLATDKKTFDRYLVEFKQKHPNAHVIIATNIARTFGFRENDQHYDFDQNGLNSDVLDMAVMVYKIQASLLLHYVTKNAEQSLESLLSIFKTSQNNIIKKPPHQAKPPPFYRKIEIYVPENSELAQRLDQLEKFSTARISSHHLTYSPTEPA